MSRCIIIVGAGPGGLASALLLAHAGFKVTVLERQPYVGGRTSSIKEEGFTFDRGPTFFLFPRILREIFQTIGRDFDKEIPMVRLDPQYRLVFGGGGQIDATSDPARLQEEVSRISPADALQLERFMTENRHKLERFSPVLESPFSSWTNFLNPTMVSLLPLLRPFASVDQELGRYFSDPRVRLAFSFQSKYLGMSPFQCPSLFTILSFLEYEHGVHHPIGGCAAISERMAQIAREMGVDIRLGEAVENLEFNGRRPTAVLTQAGHYPCDALVINADFARFMIRHVPNRLRRTWTDQKITKARYSCSTFMLYLGVRGLDPLAHHTIYFSSEYRRNLDDITHNYELSEDPSIYVQNASVTDSTLAPEGCSTLYVLIPVPHLHSKMNWRTLAPLARKRALEQLEKLGVKDLESRILFEKMVTPEDWDAMEIHRGATFSMAHSLDQMLHLRPQNRFAELDGVYLVGGGTHPGSGLPVIYSSARISTSLLCQDFGVTPPYQPPLTFAPRRKLAGATHRK